MSKKEPEPKPPTWSRRRFLKAAAVSGAGILTGVGLLELLSLFSPTEGGISWWEKEGSRIPTTTPEWENVVNLFDYQIKEAFGPPVINPTTYCFFLPVLPPDEQESIQKELPSSTGLLIIPLISPRKIGPNTIEFHFRGSVLRIPNPQERNLQTMGDLGDLLAKLKEQQIFELGLLLSLVGLRIKINNKNFQIAPNVLGGAAMGFSLFTQVPTQEKVQMGFSFSRFDALVRLYILLPFLQKHTPVLFQQLTQAGADLSTFSFLNKLKISPQTLQDYYFSSNLIGFIEKVGKELFARGARVKNLKENLQIRTLGYLAIECFDSPLCEERTRILNILSFPPPPSIGQPKTV